jgi:hypothetical protein
VPESDPEPASAPEQGLVPELASEPEPEPELDLDREPGSELERDLERAPVPGRPSARAAALTQAGRQGVEPAFHSAPH